MSCLKNGRANIQFDDGRRNGFDGVAFADGRRNGFDGVAFADGRRNGACNGIREINQGAAEVSLGLNNLEASKKAIRNALHETEEVVNLLRFGLREVETAERLDCNGLRHIRHGVREVEEELRRPRYIEPACSDCGRY